MSSLTSGIIGNMALDFVGSDEIIESYNEQSVAAGLLRRRDEPSREMVLESYNWSFARVHLTLALDGDVAPTNWAFRYQYPSNCLKARYIVNPSDINDQSIPFDVMLNEAADTKTIVTDWEEAELAYTANIVSPGLFSQHFGVTLAHLLAHRMAPKLTRDQNIIEREWQLYNQSLQIASGHDANEAVAKEPRDGDLVSARA